jgi:hypothetical protein
MNTTVNFGADFADPGSTIIKLFQNVPKVYLEMLFPNSQVRMITLDKTIIGGSALLGGAVVTVTKPGTFLLLIVGLLSYWMGFSSQEVAVNTLHSIALGIGAGVLGYFIFK